MTSANPKYTVVVKPSIHREWSGGGSLKLTIFNLTDEPMTVRKMVFKVAEGVTVGDNTGMSVQQNGQAVIGTIADWKQRIPARESNFVIVNITGNLRPFPNGFMVDGIDADIPPYTSKPTKVGNLRTVMTTGRAVSLRWDPSTDEVGVTHYETTVLEKHPADSQRAQPVISTGTSVLVGDLRPNTDYVASVVAVNVADRKSEPAQVEFDSGEAKADRPSWDVPVMPFIDYAGVNDVTGTSQVNRITPIAEATGVRGVSLGFITVQSDQMEPCWGSFPDYPALDGSHNAADVAAFKKLGGYPVISLGGWNNHIPEYVYTNEDKVFDWYTKILDAYGIDRVDFDIEGAAQRDKKFIDRHIRIAYRLLAERPNLRISYTLPVDAGRERRPPQVDGPDHPDNPVDLVAGFNTDGKEFIRRLAAVGILPSLFNGMTMTMGNKDRPQGKEAIIALRYMHRDLINAYPHLTDEEAWARLGACPMFGINDGGEFFSLADMTELVEFAKAKETRLGCVSGWDAQRDWNSNRTTTRCAKGSGEVYKCTREDQTPGAFLRIAVTFAEAVEMAAAVPTARAGERVPVTATAR